MKPTIRDIAIGRKDGKVYMTLELSGGVTVETTAPGMFGDIMGKELREIADRVES